MRNNTDLLGFFCVVEQRTQEVVELADELAHEFSSKALDFGKGVKKVTATLILTDPQGLGEWHKLTPPKFYPGLRCLDYMGLVVEVEDALEFCIRPEFKVILRSRSKSEVAKAIASALMDANAELRGVDIPNFDMSLFLSELGAFLINARE
ncbi:MAG: hypothetical protein AAGF72_15280 [Pseudomonadota bacterium]